MEAELSEIKQQRQNERDELTKKLGKEKEEVERLFKQNDAYKSEIKEKEELVAFLTDSKKRLNQQNDELTAELQRISNAPPGAHPTTSPQKEEDKKDDNPLANREQIAKRRHELRNQAPKTARVPLHKMKVSSGLLSQHILTMTVKRGIPKDTYFVSSADVVEIDYDGEVLTISTEERRLEQEALKRAKEILVKSVIRMSNEVGFLNLDAPHKKLTRLNKTFTAGAKQPKGDILENQQEFDTLAKYLLSEKTAIIKSLQLENEILRDRLNAYKNSAVPIPAEEDGDFLDSNNSPRVPTYTTFGEEMMQKAKHFDRPKLILDKVVAMAMNPKKEFYVGVSSRMIHKLIYKVYQEIVADYKENLENFEDPFHFKPPLVHFNKGHY